MRVLATLLRNLLRHRTQELELDDEVQAHLDLLADEYRARGLDDDAARRAARLELGGTSQVTQAVMDVKRGAWLRHCWQDLRVALHSFSRSPAFAATAAVSLAVGIAAATGLFSVVNAVLLNPFPFPDVERIVGLDIVDRGKSQGLGVTGRQLVALQQSDVLEGAFVSNTWDMTLSGRHFPEAVRAQSLSADGLNVLGVSALFGRVFNEADGPVGQQPERLVVLTHRFWLRHFGGQPGTVGQTITLNGDRYAVIGVLHRQFFPTGPEIFLPLHVTSDAKVYWGVRARLKRGVTPRMAELRLQRLFDEFAGEAPARFPKGARPHLWRLVEARRTAGYVPALLLVFASSMLLLLLACANVSILLLVRAASRVHEFVVRAALGASRGRLIRQLLVESLPLACSGAALGVAATYWGLPAVLRLLPTDALPVADLLAVPVNGPVLLFSAGLAVASTLVCGLSPALWLSRPRLTSTTRITADVQSRRWHHLLLATQVALTVPLLAGTGAASRGLIDLYRAPLGYDPHNVLIAVINLPENGYREWVGRATFYERLRTRMTDVPQVESVALATFSGIPPRSDQRSIVEVPGRDTPGDEAPILQRVSGHYFATMRIPLVQGRVWLDSEDAGTPHVAIINQAMARERWPDQSPIGRRVRMPDYITSPTPFRLAAPGSDGWFEIIGVVGDTPNVGLHEPPAPAIYVPYTLMLGDSVNVILRTSHDPVLVARSLRQAVGSVDINQAVKVVTTAQDELASAGWARERFVTLLLLGFAALALMLAIVGLYSVVSYSVSCRRKEFAIRTALGADRGSIVSAAVQPAVLAIAAGLLAGLALSVGLTKVVAQWSIGKLDDPVVLVTVSLTLIGAALVSAAVPAIRAASAQPVEALRVD